MSLERNASRLGAVMIMEKLNRHRLVLPPDSIMVMASYGAVTWRHNGNPTSGAATW